MDRTLYAYVDGNPVNRRDPSGLDWTDFWDGVADAALIGAGAVTLALCAPEIVVVGAAVAGVGLLWWEVGSEYSRLANGTLTEAEADYVAGGATFGLVTILAGVAVRGQTTSGAASCPARTPPTATQPNRIYSARVLIRSAEEPGPYHNFPESFNAEIFESGTQTVTKNFWNVYVFVILLFWKMKHKIQVCHSKRFWRY